MKTFVQPRTAKSGSVLMVTLVTGMIIGVVLASYLTLVSHQNATVARSQSWNAALAAAEAGVEEALAQLNPDDLGSRIEPDPSANGWYTSDGNFYQPPAPSQRSLINASYSVRFSKRVGTNYPIIYAEGYATNAALNAVLVRKLEVKTTKSSFVFARGMTSLGDIDMNGNGIRTDSYNSTNGSYSVKTARAHGDVVSVNGIVDVGNANIYGNLLTGPNGAASVNTLKNNGLVGDFTWKGPGIQAGHYLNDYNAEYPNVGLPNVSFLGPTAGMTDQTVNGTKYAYAFTSTANIEVGGFSKPIYVGSNSTVNLYITGDVKITSGSIKIEKGGTLNIYMKGTSFDLGGGGVINDNKSPLNFSYYGLPQNTGLKIGGNTEFYGAFYAPQATVTLNGNGDFYGAIVGKTVAMNGTYNFHYDEALPATVPISGYVAVSWREL